MSFCHVSLAPRWSGNLFCAGTFFRNTSMSKLLSKVASISFFVLLYLPLGDEGFFSPSTYYRWPNILLRGWCQNPFPLVPGKAAAISSLSPSWIYLNPSSRLLLKCFSPFRPCVPRVTLSAEGCNQLPFTVDTGRGNEQARSYWSDSRGQGCGEGEWTILNSFHCSVCFPLLTIPCYCVRKAFNNRPQKWLNGNTRMKRTW